MKACMCGCGMHMAIVVASGTVHLLMSAVGAAVRVAMHGTSRRRLSRLSRPQPRFALARPSPQQHGKGGSLGSRLLITSVMHATATG